MPARTTLQVVQGTARHWQLQIFNRVPNAPPWSATNPSPFQASDVLAATLWAGQSQASILTLAPTWLDVVSGTYTLPMSAAQSAALVPSMYAGLVTVARGSQDPASVSRLRVEVVSAAGATVAGSVYCTFEQLVNYAGWIQDLQDENDLAGFLGQRVRARSWLDDILVSRYKYGAFPPMLGQPGFGPFFMGMGGVDPFPSKWFRDTLSANTGVGGTPALICYDQVIEIVCCRSIYLICRDEISRREDNPYIKLGLGFGKVADNMVKTLRAEVDINGDGYADYVVNCGATSLR